MKIFLFASFGLWLLPLKLALAYSGSYIAANHAEFEKDFKNASYYFVDLVSKGETNSEIIKKSIIYAALANDFNVATAVSRKLNELDLVYPPSNLILLAEAIRKKDKTVILQELNEHKRYLPKLFQSIADFWLLVLDDEKEKAFNFLNSLNIENESQLQVLNYNQLLAYVYYNDYELAKALFENMQFSDFLFDSESAIALLQFFELNRDQKIVDTILSKIRNASNNAHYAVVLEDSLSRGLIIDSIKITPFDQLAELFFRWAQSVQLEGNNAINKPFYLSLSNYAVSSSSFLKFKLASLLIELENYELSSEILSSIEYDDLFFIDCVVENSFATEQIQNSQVALEYLREIIEGGSKNSNLLMTYGSLQRSEKLYKDSILSYSLAIDEAKKENYPDVIWQLLFLRGISYERLKNWPSAEADFTDALKIRPDQPQVLNYMGYSLLQRKEKLDQAMRMIKIAAERSPNSYHIVDSLGWAYFKIGEFETALYYLEKAMELEATDPIVNDHLGDAFWMLGRKREARFQWKKSLSLDPDPIDEKQTKNKLMFGLDAK